jgi:lantibiotic biosynthesis protein
METMIQIWPQQKKAKKLFEKGQILIEKFQDNIASDNLYSGSLGLCLYFTSLAISLKNEEYKNKAIDVFYEVIENINTTNGLQGNSLSVGFSGAGLVAEILLTHNFIERENIEEVFETLNKYIFEVANTQTVTHQQIDNLHGSTSCLQYLSQEKILHHKQITDMVYFIWNARKETKHGYYWYNSFTDKINEETEEKETEINFSFAHGQAGIISILTNCYNPNIPNGLIVDAVKQGLNFCLYHQNGHAHIGDSLSIFPQNITGDAENLSYNYTNRLAWCYGDLGMCEALIKAGKTIPKLENYALIGEELALKTLSKRSMEETNISKSFLCHGYAGNALFYNHFYKLTHNPAFLEGYEYWMTQLLTALEKELEDGFYKDEKVCDLLNGLTGINLVLLEYFTGIETNWQKAVLL